MKYIHTGVFTLIIGVLLLNSGWFIPYAYGHDGEEHGTETTLTLEEMEDLIVQLKQIIELLILRNELERKIVISLTPVESHTIDAIHDEHHDMDAPAENMDDHMENHDAIVEAIEKKLIIELEEHSGKTHVHIRYTDKAEDMFFAEAVLTDTNGVVEVIQKHSGLSDDVIRAAIVYTQM